LKHPENPRQATAGGFSLPHEETAVSVVQSCAKVREGSSRPSTQKLENFKKPKNMIYSGNFVI
jgi:hypothetical protein